jgi:hypothetical protein
MLMKQAATYIAPLTGLNEEEVLRLLEVPPQAEMGDAAFPCFALAKSLKKAPTVIATDLATRLQTAGLEATPAGPYVNLRFNREELAPSMLKELGDAAFGKLQLGQGSRVVIDMSSPNIAKPFGIGHLRSTVIGAALYRLYNEAGYASVSVNHLETGEPSLASRSQRTNVGAMMKRYRQTRFVRHWNCMYASMMMRRMILLWRLRHVTGSASWSKEMRKRSGYGRSL